MTGTEHDLLARVRRLEGEAAIQRLILSYGPAADAGMSQMASHGWAEDGVYDWDAEGAPYPDRNAVAAMLDGEAHKSLIAEGVGHFAGPPLIKVDGDKATAVNYSLIMRREDRRFVLWRVSAVRWDFARTGSTWKVTKRTNRLLDGTGAGRELFAGTLRDVFSEDRA